MRAYHFTIIHYYNLFEVHRILKELDHHDNNKKSL